MGWLTWLVELGSSVDNFRLLGLKDAVSSGYKRVSVLSSLLFVLLEAVAEKGWSHGNKVCAIFPSSRLAYILF